jgi:hypothetical protein
MAQLMCAPGKPGISSTARLALSNPIFETSLIVQRPAEVAVRDAVIGIECQGAPAAIRGFGEPSRLLQCIPEVQMCLRRSRQRRGE